MGLEVSNLVKIYSRRNEHHTALDGVSFSAPAGAFVTLLGPSGCGKSTLLNMLAGLDKPTSGKIAINSTVVYDSDAGAFVAPGKRDISMVFQSYAIWPHMTVRENVAFPLLNGRKKSTDRKLLEKAIDTALEKVHLSSFADRPAPLLSGGQQQRVSLARAIAQSPKLILLDEPLSNLDANLRDVMQKEIRNIVSGEGITAVYVTHDQKEALAMSDVIIVLKDGHIEQIGSPNQIYYRPQTKFVAQFMGAPNLIAAKVRDVKKESGQVVFECALGHVFAMLQEESVSVGDDVTLVLRQEDFEVSVYTTEKSSFGVNEYLLPIKKAVFLGEKMELICAAEGLKEPLSAYVNARLVPAEARHVCLYYPPSSVHYIKE